MHEEVFEGAGFRLELDGEELAFDERAGEDGGRIVSAWTAEGGGAARSRATPKKIYTITESGRALLAQEKAAWRQLAACIEEMLAQPEEEE